MGHRSGSVLCGAGLLLAMAAASAAELPQGTWHGTLAPPERAEVAVELHFADMAGRPLATLSTPDGVLGLSGIALNGGVLSFGFFTAGVSVACELPAREDGSFAGDCRDRRDRTWRLAMTPAR